MTDPLPPPPARVLSHGHPGETWEQTIVRVRETIVARGELPYVTVAEQLDLLDQLAAFPFGRFLLQNRGWNGYWTDYVMQHPATGRLTGTDPDGRALTPLERALLDTFPTVLATQERARIFAAEIDKRIRPGATLASIPCGLMRDLLGRDLTGAAGIRLVGIDIDDDSLERAAELAAILGLSSITSFIRSDAWSLGLRDAFDLICSNGLNIYEPDGDRVIALYRGFREALKADGVLVTSAVTPPPIGGQASDWDVTRIDPQAMRLQSIVAVDIIGVTFQCFRSAETTTAQLSAAGFRSVEVIWDAARIFPTFVAAA
jgi:Methylase involved in ubiquinone/menaquinone biosynthesis